MHNIDKENEGELFWKIRSAHYDKLFWTKDETYLEEIVKLSEIKNHHLVLDVGTGTGAIANRIKKLAKHVVAVDSSDSMLDKGNWGGVSIVKWDIGEALFKDNTYNRVIARMVFHHILDNLDRAILRCYDLLKTNGKIIIAEGVPPLDDEDVVSWYTEMFKLKEKRRTFIPGQLIHYLRKNGFKNVSANEHYIEKFSIGNWLQNSGLDADIQNEIFNMHKHAPSRVKDAYQMEITGEDCLIKARNIIVVGEKHD